MIPTYYTTLQGTFLMTQAFARSLAVFCGEEEAIPGAVVNVSSVVTKVSFPVPQYSYIYRLSI